LSENRDSKREDGQKVRKSIGHRISRRVDGDLQAGL